jgi:cyclomaltodextrinase
MPHWVQDAVFYHIYPLGLCGAPERNDFHSPPIPRLEKLYGWIEHLHYLGANAVYLGPLFESSSHGYNTVDYYHVDRRLGTDDTLARLTGELHRQGIRVVLDGVFNHVGRNFWAFRDVQIHRQNSTYADWFAGLHFDQPNAHGDPFSYEGWAGHTSLVKLNLGNPAVREHLFGAVRSWIERFDIDGLRLDAADCVDHEFLRELAGFCRSLKPDFWLMGEVVHGDYNLWANPNELDSVTNYECYKGLYSSFNERNFFEIAHSLQRQFGPEGIYRGLGLYNFIDNHDVSRIASTLHDPADLPALHLLLFSMPGVPSIYAGSEFGISGLKEPHSDAALRPALDLPALNTRGSHRELVGTLHCLSEMRRSNPALRYGDYQPLHVSSQGLAFARQSGDDLAVVAINGGDEPLALDLDIPAAAGRILRDQLGPGGRHEQHGDHLHLQVPPRWGCVLT